MNTCEAHGGAVVVYESTGRYKSNCPMCDLQNDFDSLEREHDLLKDNLKDAEKYAEELAEELEQYRQPVPEVREHDGRHFRV